MRLLVIRHGESEGDLRDVHEGRADFPLTECGHRQAEAMAAWVARSYPLDAIYCSTLRRARQTAEHLSAATGAPVTPDERLMEFDNGLLAGMDRSEAAEKYPEAPGLPLHEARYRQESALAFRHRAECALSWVLSRHTAGQTVAVVSHGGMIGQLYRAFLRLPVDGSYRFFTGDTGVHEWFVDGEWRGIVYANRTAHTDGL